jgi:hypothetical protein
LENNIMVTESSCLDPSAAAESNEQTSIADEQLFPDYDQHDPGPVYD